MVETRCVAAARLFRVAALQPGVAGERHYQDVTQIGMAGAGKMRVRKPDDAAVVVAVPGCPAIGLLARLDARIRAELDHAERNRRARVRVPLPAGTDERIDRGIEIGRASCRERV